MHPGHRDDVINAAAGKSVFQRIGQALFIARQKRDQEAFHILWKNRPARILEPPCRQRWKMAKRRFFLRNRHLPLRGKHRPNTARGVIFIALEIVRACRAKFRRAENLISRRKRRVLLVV